MPAVTRRHCHHYSTEDMLVLADRAIRETPGARVIHNKADRHIQVLKADAPVFTAYETAPEVWLVA